MLTSPHVSLHVLRLGRSFCDRSAIVRRSFVDCSSFVLRSFVLRSSVRRSSVRRSFADARSAASSFSSATTFSRWGFTLRSITSSTRRISLSTEAPRTRNCAGSRRTWRGVRGGRMTKCTQGELLSRAPLRARWQPWGSPGGIAWNRISSGVCANGKAKAMDAPASAWPRGSERFRS